MFCLKKQKKIFCLKKPKKILLKKQSKVGGFKHQNILLKNPKIIF
jgi:hypothetical protein